MFNLFYITAVKKDLKSLPDKLRQVIYGVHFPKIMENPFIGKSLQPPFKGYMSYSFKFKNNEYRIVYKIKKAELIILIVMLGSRENLYNRLDKRLK